MSRKKVQSDSASVAGFNRDSDLTFAAEAPGGPEGSGSASSPRAVHDSPGDVGIQGACCISDDVDCDCYVDYDSESLVPFVFTCKPGDVPPGDYQDAWHPEGMMAFWDHDEMIVACCTSGDKWKVICFEQQRRPSRHPFYTWYCDPQQPADPATEEWMEKISS